MRRGIAGGLIFLFLSCGGGGGIKEKSPEELLREHLSKGEGKAAIDILKNGVDLSDCEFHYASMLGEFLSLVETVNDLLNSTPADFLSPAVDYGTLVENALAPFEEKLNNIDASADYIIENDCSYYLPEGLKIEIGKEGRDYHFMVILGDEWDKGEAMLFSVFSNSILALFDLILSHSLDIDSIPKFETYGEFVPTLRAMGGLFSLNPDFLKFSKNSDLKVRFYNIPHRLQKIAENIYSNGGTTLDSSDDTGFLSFIFNEDQNADDDVIGFVDRGETGDLNVGDEFVLGIKSLNVADTIIFPDVVSGIHFKIPSYLYTYIKTAFNEIKNYSQTLYDQMEGVDNPSHLYNRLSLAGLNNLLTLFGIPEVPEVIEVDLSAFFKDPKPLRRYLPYWYDHDNDPTTPDELMVEGESLIPKGYPSIITGDSAHFPENTQFRYDLNEESTISPRIPEDHLFPSYDYVIPYIAFQDPTFNGAVYVNPGATGEGAYDFIPPDNYLLNRAIARLMIYINEELREISPDSLITP